MCGNTYVGSVAGVNENPNRVSARTLLFGRAIAGVRPVRACDRSAECYPGVPVFSPRSKRVLERPRRNGDDDAENTCTDANPARSADTGAGRSRTYTAITISLNENQLQTYARRRRRNPINEPSDNRRHRPNTNAQRRIYRVLLQIDTHDIICIHTFVYESING